MRTCFEAAGKLAEQGIDAEVIDLRTLKPLDEATLLRSVQKTGRCVVVHEANGLCGVGAEVAARIGEKAFSSLKAPVLRLTGPDVPPPAAWHLEQAIAPNAETVRAAAERLVRERARAA